MTATSQVVVVCRCLSSPSTVRACLAAIKQILPRDVAIQILIRWYCTHNAPGSNNGQSEWTQFIRVLLGMMGYDVTKITLTNDVSGPRLNAVLSCTRRRVG